MPPEPTNAAKRRSNRRDVEEFKFDGGHAREIESKRNRGEISCAECRRLKIKCDKTIPCTSCQRRGCGSLCPNGSLATGQGTRFVLAATEHLHKRIAKISDRVRALEDALATLQSKHYDEPHPLLRDDLLSANMAQDDEDEAAAENPDRPSIPRVVMDAFGTLWVQEQGIARFFGPTGGQEILLMNNQRSTVDSSGSHSPSSLPDSTSPPSLSNDFTLYSQSFPFPPIRSAGVPQKILENELPPWERAHFLAQTFLDQISSFFRGLTRLQLMDEMLPTIYKHHFPSNLELEEDYSGPHDLALLFIVFAIGILLDLPLDPLSSEAADYHQLAREALSRQPVLEKPSLATIQTIRLLAIYHALNSSESGDDETSMETTWSLTTLAIHLSQTIGLHRDGTRWGLSPKMVERRRILFWDLFMVDAWESFNTGRPPSFSLAYIDCCFPQKVDSQGDIDLGSLALRFTTECVVEVASKILTADPPSYATIMELDRKVREYSVSDDALPVTSTHLNLALSKYRCILEHIREMLLLYIHRSFFARALIDYPMNPLKSPYAHSFLAAYRASATILKSIKEHFTLQPMLYSKFWGMWTFAFSAGIVFGTIITHGPRSPLAGNAMTELELACQLFTKAAVHNRRAGRALSILKKLNHKARVALASARHDQTPDLGHQGSMWNIKQEDNDDELAIFSGHSRVVSSKQGSPSPAPFSPHSMGTSAPPPYPLHRIDTHALSAMPAYYPETSHSSSPSTSSWTPDSCGEGYHHAEQFIPSQERRISQPYQPNSQHHTPPEQIQLPSAPNYQWQNASNYYGSQQYHPSPTVDSYHPQGQLFTPPFQSPQSVELARLGLAARDSRLDDTWSSFMQDSGILDGGNASNYASNNTGR